MVYPTTDAKNFDMYKPKWEEVTNLLNIMEGPKRTVKQWKSVFTDLKSNIKKKMRKMRSEQLQTGGGPNAGITLNEIEEKLFDLINPIVIEGLPNISEGGIEFENEEDVQDVQFARESPNLQAGSNGVIEEMQSLENMEPAHKSLRKERVGRKRRFVKPRQLSLDESTILNQLISSNYAIANALNNIARAI